MHDNSLHLRQHEHIFGQDQVKPGERRTALVIAVTAIMMVIEIWAGVAFGSMALLADGLHMGSHAMALGITVFAYLYARRHARDRRFSFGTGKVNALAGFGSAILLLLFSAMMAWESAYRLYHPVRVVFDQAIVVAVVGLVVNVFSALILDHGHDDDHDHGHDDDHDHGHDDDHDHGHDHHPHGHRDHNLRAAYLHVLADALTSLFAIVALSAGKFLGLPWLDPVMGIAGAVLVFRWSWSLIKETSEVLLDKQISDELSKAVTEAIERESGDRIVDLHLWSIGPGIYAAAISIVAGKARTPEYYKELLPDKIGLAHTTVEIYECGQESR